MATLKYYLNLPWTIRKEERGDDGSYIALTIAELPGFVVAGIDEDELSASFWDALRSHILSFIDHGEIPPVPAGLRSVKVPTTFAIELADDSDRTIVSKASKNSQFSSKAFLSETVEAGAA